MSDNDFSSTPNDERGVFVTTANLSESKPRPHRGGILQGGFSGILSNLTFWGFVYVLAAIVFGQIFIPQLLGNDAPNSLLGLSLGLLVALPFAIYAIVLGLETQSKHGIPVVRNLIFIRDFGQAIFLMVVIAFIYLMLLNLNDNLRSSGLIINFRVLERTFGTEVSEGPDPASTSLNETIDGIPLIGEDLANSSLLRPNSNFRALLVGMVNTLRVVWLSLIFATLLGILIGVGLLSNNWLVNKVSVVYVEIFRNTPLLVQLFFISKGLLLLLPTRQNATEPLGFLDLTYLNGQRTVGINSESTLVYALVLGLFLAYMAFLASKGRSLGSLVTQYLPVLIMVVIGTYIALGVGWKAPLSWDLPISEIGQTQEVDVPNWIHTSDQATLSPIEVVSEEQVNIPSLFYLSGQRFSYPKIVSNNSANWFLIPLVMGIIVGIVLWRWRIKVQDNTGQPANILLYFSGAVFSFGLVGYILALVMGGELPLALEIPAVNRQSALRVFRPEGGSEYTAEYIGLFISLVLYTAAFIADIVRAGIQSVPWGQVEASRAVGLNNNQTLRMIVLPQAMRLIIPPLTNQYLNLAKNSSLAIAIGFADLYGVATIVSNQTGQSVALFGVIMVTYLAMSLIISAVMNGFNSFVQIKER